MLSFRAATPSKKVAAQPAFLLNKRSNEEVGYISEGVVFPSRRIRLLGLQSVRQRRGGVSSQGFPIA